MDISKKIAALVCVAKSLNQNAVTWAAGGSFLLYIKGIVDEFRDIDIMISEKDVEKARLILDKIGQMQEVKTDKKFASKAFLKYKINGIDFDIIAGFVIISDDVRHYFPLKNDDVKDVMLIDDAEIPLQSIKDWETYYLLMGRADKAELIQQYLLRH